VRFDDPRAGHVLKTNTCAYGGDVVPITAVSVKYDGRQGKIIIRKGLPLAVAHAVTVHKSQGMSLDAVCVRVTEFWDSGQAYVAMSRCRTLRGVTITGGLRKEVFFCDLRALDEYHRMRTTEPIPLSYYNNAPHVAPVAIDNYAQDPFLAHPAPPLYVPDSDPGSSGGEDEDVMNAPEWG
jgi:hypothetical protein